KIARDLKLIVILDAGIALAMIIVAIFIIPPYIIKVDRKPKMDRVISSIGNLFLCIKSPIIRPIAPKAYNHHPKKVPLALVYLYIAKPIDIDITTLNTGPIII